MFQVSVDQQSERDHLWNLQVVFHHIYREQDRVRCELRASREIVAPG